MIKLSAGWYRANPWSSILCASAYYDWQEDISLLGTRMHRFSNQTYLLGGDVGIRVL